MLNGSWRPRLRFFGPVLLSGFLAGFAGLAAFGQSGQLQSQPQDPLITMMMSQPKVDLEQPVVAIAGFDPPIVRPGQKTIYRVTFNTLEQMVQWPKVIAVPSQLSISPGAHGQILQPAGSTLVPRSTFNSRVVASEAGTFTVPQFAVEVDG